MIGQTLGHYRILEKVGAGGTGVVYRARDEQLDREVAVKVLHSGTLNDDTARKHFRKEALALAKLNHPNIGTVYEFDTQEGIDFLVMEYFPGKTLANQLVGKTLSEKDVIALGIQIASALEEAHEHGIVHRDLKPGNIAITAKGSAKVLDFGLAKVLNPAEEGPTEVWADSQAGAGTLPYMPPEQLKGQRVDARADIYTIGAVLYEMATGRRAFRDSVVTRLIEAILHQPPIPIRALNPRVSPELESIILKCLDKDPGRRYQSATELLVDLHRLQPTSSGNIAVPVQVRYLRGARKWIVYTVAGLLVAAVSLMVLNTGGWRDRLLGRTRAPQIRSLAVLPFENLSGDRDQDYFADGLTEALITDLGQLQALRVISRTSVMGYRETKKPLSQIARELNVDAIVEGSASRSDGSARVTARLVYGPTDTQIWSRSYQRDLQNVLDLQAEVAGAIVSEIHLTLTPPQQAQLTRGRTVNPAAHEAYLKGRFLTKGTSSQQREARQYFEEALRIDPNYAPAYAGLADYYLSPVETRPIESMAQAKQFALKALDLDPGLAEAHVELALIHFYADWDWAAADREFKLAIQLNPSDAEAHRTNSFFLSAMGRGDEALAESKQAQQLDPLSIWTQITAGYVFYFTRKYDEAIAQCRRALEWDPNSAGAYDCLGTSYLAKGMYDQAIAASSKASELSNNDPTRLVGLGRAYALADRKSDARNVLGQLRQFPSHTYVSPYFFAIIYAALRQNDEAFTWLQEALRQRDLYLAWLRADTAVDPLRRDPRFQELLGHIGPAN
jgi:TolB-like protein/tetratricopeptide (TPR) repeat protein/tRNA A-37 threonylcarbamoyl transferase component Bud32